MEKILIVLVIPVCLIWYLIGIKKAFMRIIALVLVLIALAITVPNCQHDDTYFMAVNIQDFTKHLENLMAAGRNDEAQNKLRKFNREFPWVARDTQQREDFFSELVKASANPSKGTNNANNASEPTDAAAASRGP